MAKKQRSSLLEMAQSLPLTRGGPPHWTDGLTPEQLAELTELAKAKHDGKLAASWNELGKLVLQQMQLPRVKCPHHMARQLAALVRHN